MARSRYVNFYRADSWRGLITKSAVSHFIFGTLVRFAPLRAPYLVLTRIPIAVLSGSSVGCCEGNEPYQNIDSTWTQPACDLLRYFPNVGCCEGNEPHQSINSTWTQSACDLLGYLPNAGCCEGKKPYQNIDLTSHTLRTMPKLCQSLKGPKENGTTDRIISRWTAARAVDLHRILFCLFLNI